MGRRAWIERQGLLIWDMQGAKTQNEAHLNLEPSAATSAQSKNTLPTAIFRQPGLPPPPEATLRGTLYPQERSSTRSQMRHPAVVLI